MRQIAAAALVVAIAILAGCRKPQQENAASGADLFGRYCATCHPDGGNILNPARKLGRADLAANGITTPEQIVAVMRHPGPRMARFDPDRFPDADARRVAEYVLATFR